jgi:hypothetical protein
VVSAVFAGLPEAGAIMAELKANIMKIKYIFPISVLIVTVFAAQLNSCAEPARPLMPVFRVASLHAAPDKIETGQEATVTAEVQNTGNMEGIYQAVLSINGEKLPAQPISIQPGQVGRATFKISRDKPGQYDLAMGNSSAVLIVKKYVERVAEISYCSEKPMDFLFAGTNSGHLVDFTPLDASFVLKKINICGGIYGSGWHGKSFEIFVLNKNMEALTSLVTPITAFPQFEQRLMQMPVWREFEMDSIRLPERFYVYVYTNAPRLQGLHLGVDKGTINQHSDVATGLPPDLTLVDMAKLYPGQWCADRSKVNWMIRVFGTIRTPE